MPVVREPAWMTSLIDQRMALLEQAASRGLLADATVIMCSLKEPEDTAFRRVTQTEIDYWNQSCDCCGKFCPRTLRTGSITRSLKDGRQVIMTFGVCPAHLPTP